MDTHVKGPEELNPCPGPDTIPIVDSPPYDYRPNVIPPDVISAREGTH